jgi:hypothetical protein
MSYAQRKKKSESRIPEKTKAGRKSGREEWVGERELDDPTFPGMPART